MAAYYSEIDKKTAAWLRELIKAGLIADGEVDERSIEDVAPSDLHGFTQCHFFAGIGGWSYALRLAGWPDDRPVWTGSCPCQPFSSAGKGARFADERHLWPAFFHLIQQCRPAIVFGEQVASALDWLDLVQTDLEATDYAFEAADLCAAGVGAPHIRQRLYWVANADNERPQGRTGMQERSDQRTTWQGGLADRMEHAAGKGLEGDARGDLQSCIAAETSWLGYTNGARPSTRNEAAKAGGFWNPTITASCIDGKQRPVPTEPAFQPLANGIPARVVRLRGYGNAIVPQVAAAFIKSVIN